MKTIKRNFDKKSILNVTSRQFSMVLCFVLLGFTSLNAQNSKKDSIADNHPSITVDRIPPPPHDSLTYTYVDTMPKFSRDIHQYLADSIRYPEDAKKKKIEGIVYMEFIVEKDGSISNIQVLRSPDNELSIEAKRVVASMPKWTPGKLHGVLVRVTTLVPVKFKLK